MKKLHRTAYLSIAFYVLASPLLSRIVGHRIKGISNWRMYAGVGKGILKGEFTEVHDGDIVQKITPLEMLGLERYPRDENATWKKRVLNKKDLYTFASDHCHSMPSHLSLNFKGHVGSIDGWIPLSSENLCHKAVDEDSP